MTTRDQELTIADVKVLLKQWEQDEYTQDTAGALRALLESQKALRKIVTGGEWTLAELEAALLPLGEGEDNEPQ